MQTFSFPPTVSSFAQSDQQKNFHERAHKYISLAVYALVRPPLFSLLPSPAARSAIPCARLLKFIAREHQVYRRSPQLTRIEISLRPLSPPPLSCFLSCSLYTEPECNEVLEGASAVVPVQAPSLHDEYRRAGTPSEQPSVR